MHVVTAKTPTPGWSSHDHRMMSDALRLAAKGQYTARPNPMVGCVIVQDKCVVGQGWHRKSGHAHAEINALAQAGKKARGATCYVSLEPCAHYGKTGPCAKALIEAGVGKVIAAMLDPNPQVSGQGFEMLKDAGILVEWGLLEAQARQLNRGFVSHFVRKRPWVTCKLAMSLDGRTALADGASKWITGKAARSDVQKLRARQDAIVTGIGTLMADNPSLNIRQQDTSPESDDWFAIANEIGFRQPVRVLLDRAGQADVSAKFFAGDTNIYWVSERFVKAEDDAHICRLPAFQTIDALLYYLSQQGIKNLLLESGRRLAGAFMRAGVIDELIVYMAPKLMGDKGHGLFELDIVSMQETLPLKLTNLRQLGDDIRLTYECVNP